MVSVFASILRFTYRSILLSGFLLLLLFPTLIRVNHYRRLDTQAGSGKADLIAVQLARRLAWLFGIRVRYTGTPAEGAVLFVANHISWLDIPVLHSACAMGFVGKAEIESWPVFNYIARVGGTIFHQRGSHDSAADVSLAMEQRLRQGRAVAIFPEGGIKPGEPMRVFHARMFRPAVEVGCPVQPVRVRYMRDGHRDEGIGFRVDENMARNFVRLLARPGAVADLHFLPTINALGQPRRTLAEASRAAVISSYETL
jgi:1-acyl-sn-glycerol-3-phosphate acyltransferase